MLHNIIRAVFVLVNNFLIHLKSSFSDLNFFCVFVFQNESGPADARVNWSVQVERQSYEHMGGGKGVNRMLPLKSL